MKNLIYRLTILLCLTLIALPTFGQDDDGGTPDDLLDALLMTPDTPDARSWFSYVDFRGMEYGRLGAERPPSLEAFFEDDAVEMRSTFWWFALLGINNGPSDTLQYLQSLGNMPETVGMDFVEVEQALEWGTVPESVTLFLGDFDEDAIATAYTNREYSATEINGLTVWCNDEVGCEGGMETDIQGRRPEVPFGGHLGQRRPLLVLDGGIAASTQLSLLRATADVFSGDERSLGETPEYRALVEALNDEYVTIQALILAPEQINDSTLGLFDRMTAEQRESQYESLTQGEPLPEFELFGIVDQASENQQHAQILLVFDSVADARTAERRIPDRINDYTSLQARRPLAELIEDRGAYYVTDIYTSEDTGKSVLILDFRAPIAPQEPDEETGRMEPSSMVNRLLVESQRKLDE